MGGGITGVFAAYFLARLGARPTIIERDHIGAHASGKNAGGLNPLHGPGVPGPMQELALTSLRLHLAHWGEIRRLSRIDFAGRLVPRLHVAIDDGELERLEAGEALHNSTDGFSARLLSRSALGRVRPQLRPDAAGGLWTEGNARVDPGSYTRAVAAAAVRHGADTVQAQAQDLLHRDGRVTGVVHDSGRLDCDGVVIATGPWSQAPEQWLGLPLPVEPIKGELLRVELAGAAPAAEITSGSVGVYAASGRTVWLGGTEDRAGFDPAPTASARARILDGVDRLLPTLGPVRVADHIAALRPVTPDGLPMLGIAPGWENVCVGMGAGRKGMLLSAGLGMAAAELLVNGATELAIGSCAPARRQAVK